MARRPKNPPEESEALTALDDLARVFWNAALAELEAELDKEEGKPVSIPTHATKRFKRNKPADSAVDAPTEKHAFNRSKKRN
jgi:hypothetical protein